MPRKTPFVFAVVLVLAAIGVALYAAAIAPTPGPTAPATVRPSAEPEPPPAPAPPAAGPSVDLALKHLDLIKPSKPKVAEDFALPMPDGLSFRLSEQRGKVVLVNFWATWCPPCLEEMPAMERLWRRHKDAGFVLVAISLDEKYGVRALPSSFVIDRQGLMAGVALGPRSWDDSAAHGLVQAMLR